MSNPIMSPWVRCFHPNPGAQFRLFCVPFAGGNAAVFRNWGALLATVEVWAIQFPGRGDRIAEPLLTYLPTLVHQIVPTFSSLCDRPYAFFGHSMGALVCFELARYFSQEMAPQHLFVSGRRAPQCPDSRSLHRLPDADFLAELRRLNGTPPQVLENAELMQFFMPILRADMAICETYQYQESQPLTCPITAFGGTEDLSEPLDLVAEWQAQTEAHFSLHPLPGDHFFLQSQEQQITTQIELTLAYSTPT